MRALLVLAGFCNRANALTSGAREAGSFATLHLQSSMHLVHWRS